MMMMIMTIKWESQKVTRSTNGVNVFVGAKKTSSEVVHQPTKIKRLSNCAKVTNHWLFIKVGKMAKKFPRPQ